MGACLMKESHLVRDCITAMIQETSIHVSVKCRIGVDEFESYEFFKNFVSTVAESGCDTFIIHARKAFLTGLDPKKNRTIPPLNYEYVYKIKKDLPDLKFIINGGFINLKDCQNQLSKVDGVMVGRAIQSNPFLLTNVDEVFYNQEPSKIDRLMVVKEYFDYIQSSFDHTSGYKLLSPLLAMCFGLPGSKKFKQNVNELIRSKDILKLKETYIDLLAA
jgi:tRNA-dihydrouridine synthase A